ncbi:hypothetical protein CHS0354_028984 [Potamilus streckersoni]|uniref:Uncharacterized protein n=1 Tax=Potamilus streckersoni TaxID=2493646 RepID=A0AAE0T6A0_9BIVA|nr:hypothetical protein CHS0354_028984 [Potamilus streckersoni]
MNTCIINMNNSCLNKNGAHRRNCLRGTFAFDITVSVEDGENGKSDRTVFEVVGKGTVYDKTTG